MPENISKFLRKSDMVLILVLALVPCIMLAVNLLSHDGSSARLEISADGRILGTYPLTEDRVIGIGDGNTCRIEDGEVYMAEANCPDQICVHSAHIDSRGGCIVCLPNKVILKIVSAESAEDAPDVIASVRKAAVFPMEGRRGFKRECGEELRETAKKLHIWVCSSQWQ